MKNKIIGSIIITVITAIVIAIVVILERMPRQIIEPQKMNYDFTSLGNKNEYVDLKNDYIFETYEDVKYYFPDAEISKDSFNKYKYLLVEITYDSCSENNIVPVDYSINKYDITIKVQYEKSCGGPCAPQYMYYLLKLDKHQEIENVNFDYEATNKVSCHDDPYVTKKPIIYLYPEEETNVTVKLAYPEKLTTTYPKYKDNWSVTAYPDGTLIDNNTNRELYGLYWEGIDNGIKQTNEGFVVAGKDTATFLEEKLAILGLNNKESEEFIIYWLPILEKNNYNYIKFSTEEEINNYMPLEVNPTPNTTIRVIMNYKPLTKKINVKEQVLVQKDRIGFTLVEWGGSRIKD